MTGEGIIVIRATDGIGLEASKKSRTKMTRQGPNWQCGPFSFPVSTL